MPENTESKSSPEIDKIRAIVQRDVNDSERYYTEWFEEKWDYLRNRYLGIREKSENADEWRSNMTMNKGFGIVTGEAANAIGTIYSDESFFALVERDEEKANQIKAQQRLMLAQKPDMKIYSKFYQCLLDCLVFGTGWIKFTWDYKTNYTAKYDLESGKVKGKIKSTKKSIPLIQVKSPYDVFIDRDADDIDEVKWIIEREYLSVEDIEEQSRFNVRSEVAALSKMNSEIKDENGNPKPLDRIVAYTRWTCEDVATVTETGHAIRNQKNPFCKIPLRPMVKYPDSRQIHGIGSLEAVADIIDYIDDLMNATADNMLLSMMKAFLVKSNSDIDTDDMDLYPGKFIRVKNFDEVTRLDVGGVGFDWVNGTKAMDAYINQAIGNLDQIDAQASQTATESRIISQRASARLKAFGRYNKDNFITWFIKTWIEYNYMFLEPEDMIKIVGKKDAALLKISAKDFDQLEDVDYMIKITGDSGLEDKTEVLQNIQQGVAMLTQIQAIDSSMPVDKNALTKELLNKSGLPENIFTGNQLDDEDNKEDKDALKAEIVAAAQQAGMTPEQWIEKLAAQFQVPPEQLIADMQAAGGVKAFQQKVEQGVKSKEANNGTGGNPNAV